jgi:hypothetical protein
LGRVSAEQAFAVIGTPGRYMDEVFDVVVPATADELGVGIDVLAPGGVVALGPAGGSLVLEVVYVGQGQGPGPNHYLATGRVGAGPAPLDLGALDEAFGLPGETPAPAVVEPTAEGAVEPVTEPIVPAQLNISVVDPKGGWKTASVDFGTLGGRPLLGTTGVLPDGALTGLYWGDLVGDPAHVRSALTAEAGYLRHSNGAEPSVVATLPVDGGGRPEPLIVALDVVPSPGGSGKQVFRLRVDSTPPKALLVRGGPLGRLFSSEGPLLAGPTAPSSVVLTTVRARWAIPARQIEDLVQALRNAGYSGEVYVPVDQLTSWTPGIRTPRFTGRPLPAMVGQDSGGLVPRSVPRETIRVRDLPVDLDDPLVRFTRAYDLGAHPLDLGHVYRSSGVGAGIEATGTEGAGTEAAYLLFSGGGSAPAAVPVDDLLLDESGWIDSEVFMLDVVPTEQGDGVHVFRLESSTTRVAAEVLVRGGTLGAWLVESGLVPVTGPQSPGSVLLLAGRPGRVVPLAQVEGLVGAMRRAGFAGSVYLPAAQVGPDVAVAGSGARSGAVPDVQWHHRSPSPPHPSRLNPPPGPDQVRSVVMTSTAGQIIGLVYPSEATDGLFMATWGAQATIELDHAYHADSPVLVEHPTTAPWVDHTRRGSPPIYVMAHGTPTGFDVWVTARHDASSAARVLEVDGTEYGEILAAEPEFRAMSQADPTRPVVLLSCATGSPFGYAATRVAQVLRGVGHRGSVYAPAGESWAQYAGHTARYGISPGESADGAFVPGVFREMSDSPGPGPASMLSLELYDDWDEGLPSGSASEVDDEVGPTTAAVPVDDPGPTVDPARVRPVVLTTPDGSVLGLSYHSEGSSTHHTAMAWADLADRALDLFYASTSGPPSPVTVAQPAPWAGRVPFYVQVPAGPDAFDVQVDAVGSGAEVDPQPVPVGGADFARIVAAAPAFEAALGAEPDRPVVLLASDAANPVGRAARTFAEALHGWGHLVDVYAPTGPGLLEVDLQTETMVYDIGPDGLVVEPGRFQHFAPSETFQALDPGTGGVVRFQADQVRIEPLVENGAVVGIVLPARIEPDGAPARPYWSPGGRRLFYSEGPVGGGRPADDRLAPMPWAGREPFVVHTEQARWASGEWRFLVVLDDPGPPGGYRVVHVNGEVHGRLVLESAPFQENVGEDGDQDVVYLSPGPSDRAAWAESAELLHALGYQGDLHAPTGPVQRVVTGEEVELRVLRAFVAEVGGRTTPVAGGFITFPGPGGPDLRVDGTDGATDPPSLMGRMSDGWEVPFDAEQVDVIRLVDSAGQVVGISFPSRTHDEPLMRDWAAAPDRAMGESYWRQSASGTWEELAVPWAAGPLVVDAHGHPDGFDVRVDVGPVGGPAVPVVLTVDGPTHGRLVAGHPDVAAAVAARSGLALVYLSCRAASSAGEAARTSAEVVTGEHDVRVFAATGTVVVPDPGWAFDGLTVQDEVVDGRVAPGRFVEVTPGAPPAAELTGLTQDGRPVRFPSGQVRGIPSRDQAGTAIGISYARGAAGSSAGPPAATVDRTPDDAPTVPEAGRELLHGTVVDTGRPVDFEPVQVEVVVLRGVLGRVIGIGYPSRPDDAAIKRRWASRLVRTSDLGYLSRTSWGFGVPTVAPWADRAPFYVAAHATPESFMVRVQGLPAGDAAAEVAPGPERGSVVRIDGSVHGRLLAGNEHFRTVLAQDGARALVYLSCEPAHPSGSAARRSAAVVHGAGYPGSVYAPNGIGVMGLRTGFSLYAVLGVRHDGALIAGEFVEFPAPGPRFADEDTAVSTPGSEGSTDAIESPMAVGSVPDVGPKRLLGTVSATGRPIIFDPQQVRVIELLDSSGRVVGVSFPTKEEDMTRVTRWFRRSNRTSDEVYRSRSASELPAVLRSAPWNGRKPFYMQAHSTAQYFQVSVRSEPVEPEAGDKPANGPEDVPVASRVVQVDGAVHGRLLACTEHFRRASAVDGARPVVYLSCQAGHPSGNAASLSAAVLHADGHRGSVYAPNGIGERGRRAESTWYTVKADEDAGVPIDGEFVEFPAPQPPSAQDKAPEVPLENTQLEEISPEETQMKEVQSPMPPLSVADVLRGKSPRKNPGDETAVS